MKAKQLRLIIPVLILAISGIAFAIHQGVGTLSAIGWREISIICPLGALASMLASKTLIPQAIISLVIAAIGIILTARAFCGWICPVPVVSRIKGFFTGKAYKGDDLGAGVLPEGENPLVHKENGKKACEGASTCSSCAGCGKTRETFDSRHVILAGSLLTTAIFGFPVFCVVCPIGLSFASIILFIRLFAYGDVTLSVILVPLLLLVELALLGKWCNKICPASAFMSLIGKYNKTLVPTIDNDKCRESAQGTSCEICASVCPQGINIRHLEAGAPLNECIKCTSCVDACPTKAVSMPLLPAKPKDKLKETQA